MEFLRVQDNSVRVLVRTAKASGRRQGWNEPYSEVTEGTRDRRTGEAALIKTEIDRVAVMSYATGARVRERKDACSRVSAQSIT